MNYSEYMNLMAQLRAQTELLRKILNALKDLSCES